MPRKTSTSKSQKNSTGKKVTKLNSPASKKTKRSSSRTQESLNKKLSSLTTSNKRKSTTTSTKVTGKTKSGRGSTAIKIIQSRTKDMFPMMNMYKFPYLFEPGPEIEDRLNKAWFDEHYGEERMKEHIRKHKLKSHQYKAYVNYWWLKDQQKG